MTTHDEEYGILGTRGIYFETCYRRIRITLRRLLCIIVYSNEHTRERRADAMYFARQRARVSGINHYVSTARVVHPASRIPAF